MDLSRSQLNMEIMERSNLQNTLSVLESEHEKVKRKQTKAVKKLETQSIQIEDLKESVSLKITVADDL